MSLPAIQPLPAVLTTAECAEVLRCKVGTVEGYIHSHELNAIQVGRERRIRAEDLLDFIAAKPSTTKGKKR